VLYDRVPAQALVARHAALTFPFQCEFGGATLDIEEGVFCPTLTNASPLLLEAVDFRPGERVLDAFAGSGAFGIVAARNGARQVVAFDISPTAVRCALHNAQLNGVEGTVEVREGTMDACVAGKEIFDLIIANPPLLPGRQTGPLGVALFDPHLNATIAFIKALRTHLSPNGRCYLLTSNVADRCGVDIERLCFQSGLVSEIAKKRDTGYESYRVHRLTWQLDGA
jgi:methylase of polypeptide subunit release factors